jgi:glycine/D-amino acid oxidase-like deaminating enzyme
MALSPVATRTPARLRAPILTDDQIVRSVAGIRPYRRGGPRIERQSVAGKTVVHNYGHGGAGFTLSWGSALAAADLVRGAAPPHARVVVLGAGVIGLSTACVLLERGFRVRVRARELPPDTTSDLAGAEWSPDIVDRGATPAARAQFAQLLRLSWRRFQALVGRSRGVSPRPIYEAEGVASGLDDLPAGIVPRPRSLASLPFAPARSGRVYQTLLIEPPVYLPALVAQVVLAGGVFERGTVASLRDLSQLDEAIIVNCLGLGAGRLFDDGAVVPIRGQLVHLRPQPLPYLLDHPNGYLVPRSDALVLGGTFEEGVSEPRTDADTSARIVADNRRFFAP